MRCARCATELIPGKRFCHACGAPVGPACPHCGATVEPGYRFCPDCGLEVGADTGAVEPDAAGRAEGWDSAGPPDRSSAASAGGAGAGAPVSPDAGLARLRRLARRVPQPLAAKIRSIGSASTGERKRVTVLFCDLVGSTGIAAGLDPEEYRDLLDEYLEICFAEIYRFEGIVNQLAGDGLMALFGAPVAHEDAPERAVRAAVAIREALARFSATALAGGGFELRTRFGINTGPVVVGAVGNDLKMDYTAIGDTTNLASRLESLAPPGGILVSEATERLIRGRFELRPLSPVEVKGKSEPIAAYEVVRALDVEGPIGIAHRRGLTPLVARDEELAQLEACYARLAGSLPQLVAIVGEAGSGKSRLLFELRQRLACCSATILEARCSSLSRVVPYAPWIAMVRSHFGLAAKESPEGALAKVRSALEGLDARPDELAERLGFFFRALPGTADGDDPDQLKRETFEAMARLVMDLSARQPLLIVFEDLHWIDELSREMLELAVAHLRHVPVMVLVTHRPEYEARWRPGAAFTELHLRPLSEPAARDLVRAVSGGELPAELERRIIEKAEGSPLVLEEIARALLEGGFLRATDGRVELTRPVDQIPIPDTVQELIGARLDRLGPGGKRAAQVASVLGRQFRRDQLAHLLAGEDVDVVAELEELERRGLIHRKHALSEDEYRFGESVAQEIAYESLLVRERRQLHERVARLLEDTPEEITPERSALLAHHFARSEDRAGAVKALLRAAGDAERLPSYGAALSLYRQAWEAAAGDNKTGAGPEGQRQMVQAALGLCRMVVLYGSTEDVDDLAGVARRARGLATDLGDASASALLCSYVGLIEMSSAPEHFAGGVELVEQGVALARQAGLELVELNISRSLAWSYFFDGRFDLALATIDAVLRELERRDGDRKPSDLHFGARFMRESILFHAGRLDEALASLRATHELAVEHGNRTIRSAVAATLSQLHFVRAEYAEALRSADAAIEVGERIGNPGAVRPSAAVALATRLELGQPVVPPRYLALIEQGMASAGMLPTHIRLVVEALTAAGDLRRAQRCVEVSLRHSGGRFREALNATARGMLLVRLGARQWGEAERSLGRAIELARALHARAALGPALIAAGELAILRGDGGRAVVELEEGREICRGLGFVRYERRAERLLAGAIPGDAVSSAVG